jgi:signal transduction histidine kinase
MSVQPTVVIIAEEAEFPRLVSARWQSERRVPDFTIVSGDVCASGGRDAFQLAIVGPVPADSLQKILLGTSGSAHAMIVVIDEAETAERLRAEFPRVLVLQRHEGWLDMLVLLAGETLRRIEAQSRASRAEASETASKRNAVLGQYVLEMRHSLNNALTSILGHSELLMLEPGAMGASERAQVTTIRNMGLRMHEILQRFSSLEKELTVAEASPEIEWRGQGRAAAVQ